MGTAIVLGSADKRKLKQLEAAIDSGLRSFVDVGKALLEIRDSKLYEGFDTFEEYCSKRWSISRPRAYQLIDSAKVVDCVSTIVDITPPKNEAQARALAELKTEQQQATAWTKAVKTAPRDSEGNPKVTAAHVRKVVDEMTCGKNPAAKTNPKPPEADPKKSPRPMRADAPLKRAQDDDNNDPVPDELLEVFESRDEFSQIYRELSALAARVKALAAKPAGRDIELGDAEAIEQIANRIANACPSILDKQQGWLSAGACE